MNNIISVLSERERQTVFECLCAAGQDTIFPEWEFETLFGITRKQLIEVRQQWPDVDTNQPDVSAAIINAMNHLLGYTHLKDRNFDIYITVQPDTLQSTLNKLISLGL